MGKRKRKMELGDDGELLSDLEVEIQKPPHPLEINTFKRQSPQVRLGRGKAIKASMSETQYFMFVLFAIVIFIVVMFLIAAA